jgi:hypothetical protein
MRSSSIFNVHFERKVSLFFLFSTEAKRLSFPSLPAPFPFVTRCTTLIGHKHDIARAETNKRRGAFAGAAFQTRQIKMKESDFMR